MQIIYGYKPIAASDIMQITYVDEYNKVYVTYPSQSKFILARELEDFLTPFFNFLIKHKGNIVFGRERLDINRYFKEINLFYLHNLKKEDRQEIIKGLSRLENKYSGNILSNKIAVALIELKNNSKYFVQYRKAIPITSTLKSLENNRLPIKRTSIANEIACEESYFGFIRAIRSGTLTTAKVLVNGKEKRMFVKLFVGNLEGDDSILNEKDDVFFKNAGTKKGIKEMSEFFDWDSNAKNNLVNYDLEIEANPNTNKIGKTLKIGYTTLALDPKTLDVYSIISDAGKLIGKLRWGKIEVALDKEQIAAKRVLKKELQNYINNIYAKRSKHGEVLTPGIRRMDETHKRMKSKAK